MRKCKSTILLVMAFSILSTTTYPTNRFDVKNFFKKLKEFVGSTTGQSLKNIQSNMRDKYPLIVAPILIVAIASIMIRRLNDKRKVKHPPRIKTMLTRSTPQFLLAIQATILAFLYRLINKKNDNSTNNPTPEKKSSQDKKDEYKKELRDLAKTIKKLEEEISNTPFF